MPKPASARFLSSLQTLFQVGTFAGTTDGQLLDRYLAGPKAVSEAAFGALVERHGPMVLRVCRRLLGSPDEAEDASQATFLILASRARSIRRRESVESWLFGVAYRIAARARADSIRRRKHETRRAEMALPIVNAGGTDPPWSDLYEEIDRLPEKLQAPLVLCYLEGLTSEEAAKRLGWSVRTLERRLATGRERLRPRLIRHGLSLSNVLLGVRLSAEAAQLFKPPAAWAESTLWAALQCTGGRVPTGIPSARAGDLAKGALKAMLRSKIKLAVCCTLLTGSLVLGLGFASVRLGGPSRAAEPQAQTRSPASANPDGPEGEVRNIKGVVVDDQGRPVVGAVVRIPRFPDGARDAMTSADGTFNLALSGRSALGGGLVVEIDNGARVGLGRFMTPAYAGWQHAPIQIVVKPTRPLTVHVKDAAGRPAAGASVAAIEPFFQAASSTSSDGVAILRIAHDARIEWVMAKKSGVGFDYFENYRSRQATDISPLPAELNLTLNGSETLSIKAVDSNDRPLPGVVFAPGRVSKPGKIRAVSTNLSPISRVATDGQGVATFDWFPKGGSGFRFATGSTVYSISKELDYMPGDPPVLTARMLRATRLSGTVRFPDGRPARGILLRTEASKGNPILLRVMTRTRADGRYDLDVPPEESYVVAVEDDDWAAPSRTGLILHEGQPQGELDFVLVTGTLLHGRVTEGPDHTASQRTSVGLIQEGPVLAKEYRHDSDNAQFGRQAVTDALGNYHFRIGPGRYTLKVLHVDPMTIEVKDEPDIVRDVSLPAPIRKTFMSGIVVEKTSTGERPVPKARVFGLRVGEYGQRLATADDTGRFESMPRLTNMVVYARGDGPLAGFIAVPEDADEVTVVVSPTATVKGRVVDAQSEPQARGWVQVQLDFGSIPSQSAHFRMRIMTDNEGRFTYAGYPVGTEGEISAFHLKDGRPTGARTAVSFRVPDLEPVELTDLVVPRFEPAK